MKFLLSLLLVPAACLVQAQPASRAWVTSQPIIAAPTPLLRAASSVTRSST